ncbi:response regulator transcription factor [Ferrimonas sp. SCSIO 43195]|nr:response regulator transcription factor [Ferrimonas sp. SCSIO 43195]
MPGAQPAGLLLIEDDIEVGQSLASLLRRKGHQVEVAIDGEQGLDYALNNNYHLILLDKLLPKLDGLEVLRQLRQKKDTPVMMLTACGAEQQRIDGFIEGADDYQSKPLNTTELLLRIDALLRRSRAAAVPLPASTAPSDELVLDREARSARWRDSEISLTPVEYQLLEVFLGHRDEVLSKPYLYQLVLNKPHGRYDRSLDMHVSNLRSKLGGLMPGKAIIKTVHGKGYRYQ